MNKTAKPYPLARWCLLFSFYGFVVGLPTLGISQSNLDKSPYAAARAGNLNTLRQHRFESKDLFIPDEKGFTPYELAALSADPKDKASLQKHVEIMFWLKQYKPEKHVYGKATVQLVQAGLANLGYPANRTDGHLGRKTTEAIQAYQKSQAFSETGKLAPAWLGGFYQSLVQDTQQRLNKIGYRVGKADGFWGAKTQKALADFRKKKKIADPDYPGLDAVTIVALGKVTNNTKSKPKPIISNGQITKPELTPSTQTVPVTDPNILRSQAALKLLGYSISVDGEWGPNTITQLKKFQASKKLQQTGKLDEATRPILHKEATRAVQKKLTKQGYNTKGSDGELGEQTQSAIKRYQKQKKLTPSGQIDVALLLSLNAIKAPVATKIPVKKDKPKIITRNTSQSGNRKNNATVQVKVRQPGRIKPSVDVTVQTSSTKILNPVGAAAAKGQMTFKRKNNLISSCQVAGKTIPLEWCEPFYPLPKNNHCEATFKPNGEVINLWCK